MIAPEKEISICNDDVGTHHDSEEEVELDDEHPHHKDGPSPRRPREATPQTQKKSIAEERAKRQIKPPSRYIEECDYVQYALTVASHIWQNRTNIDVHMAYASASKNTKNAGLFARTALPVSLLRPPGSVNPAANMIVANRAATTDNVFRI
uniref:Uncharacterized protein n=1 Tax=Chenopodium quinoa TaxID=63459 RepID=A0A803NCZ3_CHEQI